MQKTQLLSAQDMVAIYRLIGECRDLGHDSVSWRRHLMAVLNRRFGGLVSSTAEIQRCNAPAPTLVGDLNVGWVDAKDAQYRDRFIEECGFSGDPHYDAMSAQYITRPGLLVRTRAELIDEFQWYGSVHFNEYRKPTRCDSSLYVFHPLAGAAPDTLFGFNLTRAVHELPFTEHDGQFFYWLFHELGPLIGRQLAAPGEPSISELPPRLRQTLDCLLQGDSEKQVAARLKVSKATVHEYVTALYRRFHVGSRAELLACWLRFDRAANGTRPKKDER